MKGGDFELLARLFIAEAAGEFAHAQHQYRHNEGGNYDSGDECFPVAECCLEFLAEDGKDCVHGRCGGDLVGVYNVDEGLGEAGVAGLLAVVGHGAVVDEAAAVNDGQLVSQQVHFAHDVAAENDGFALGLAGADELDDAIGGDDIEAGGGLVEDDHLRIVGSWCGLWTPFASCLC